MKRTIFILILAALGVDAAFSRSSVWKVTDGDSYCYLGGTVHILSQEDYPFPDEFDFAYFDSEILVFETDISEFQSPEMVPIMIEHLFYPEGQSLEDYLTPEIYGRLTEKMDEIFLGIEYGRQMMPGLLGSVISAQEFALYGYTETGVDQFYFNRGGQDEKEMLFLETAAEQVAFLGALGEGNENEYIEYLLDESGNSEEYIKDLIRQWKEGNSVLMVQTLEEMKQLFPDVYDTLILNRNRTWLNHIKDSLENDTVEFVLVGSMHFHGSDGLLASLENEGCQVEPLMMSE